MQHYWESYSRSGVFGWIFGWTIIIVLFLIFQFFINKEVWRSDEKKGTDIFVYDSGIGSAIPCVIYCREERNKINKSSLRADTDSVKCLYVQHNFYS